MLVGDLVTLRLATAADVSALALIRAEPAVYQRWRGEDLEAEVIDAIQSTEVVLYAIEFGDSIVGAVQSYEEADPDYRHAGMDIFLAPGFHGRGLGSDAVRTLARHLISEGHHRLVIDPAVDNSAAIAAYQKVGFRIVGTMRQYERGVDGTWHDGVLMELLATEFEVSD